MHEAKELQKDGKDVTPPGGLVRSMSNHLSTGGSTMLVPSRLQKARIAEAMTMVEREGAVIDAVMVRLDRLSVDS